MPIGNFSPPPPEDRRIRIHELEECGITPRGCRQWKVSISCGTYHAVVNLADPFTASQETRLRWVLEEHSTHHPFESYRSHAASKELWGYSMSLVDQLNLHEVLTYPHPVDTVRKRSLTGHSAKSSTGSDTQDTRRRWYVDIEGFSGGVAESMIHGLHWEALEHPDIWPSHLRPCLIVRRKVFSSDLLTHGPIIAIRSQTFRILLVVPHPLHQRGGRPIAKPLVDIIGRLSKGMTGATTPIQLEIVRPGSWKSLQDHLRMRGRGYFHLVHFAVHGKVINDKVGKQDLVSLAFVSDHSSRKRSWRPATQVSALLSTYGVKLVVMNASRSAKASGACEANIAETFVRDGVRAVIAFPYKVLNSGTEIFMSTFYQCLLAGSWDFAIALSEARRAMMEVQLREGSFGIKVSIEDWIVPVLYHNGGTEVSVAGDDIGGYGTPGKNDLRGIFSKFHGLLQANNLDPKLLVTRTVNQRPASLISRRELPQGEIVGRDGDIFSMEGMLDTSILRVVGLPGIGKSTLILHLCWWWKTTSLVQDASYFDWHEKPYLNVEMIARELYLSLFPLGAERGSTQRSARRSNRNRSPVRGVLLQHWSRPRSPSPPPDEAEIFPDDWFQKTLSRLRETPYLIVFDSLESSDATVKHNGRLKREMNEFLESLQGGKTIVLVVSNKQECWLNNSTVKFRTYHLMRLEAGYAIEFAGRLIDRYGGDRRRFWGAENKKYLHKLMKMSEMNPLAMNLTLPHITIHEDSPQTTFISLLQGTIPLDTAHDTRAMYGVADLLGRLDNISRQLLLCLAPFWTRLPKDIDPYLHSLLVHKVFPSMTEVVEQPTARNPSEKETQRENSIVSSTGLLSRYNYIVGNLLSLELLSDGDTADVSDPSSIPSPQYYRVHPLLTIFIRQTVEKEHKSLKTTITTAVTRAFLSYYTQRSTYWFDHPDETYDIAAQEIREEEINFLSVISIPFQSTDPKELFEIFPLNAYSRFASMVLVDKELSSNASLIVRFSDLILQRFEELRAKSGDRKVHESAVETSLFASNWLCEYHSENSPVSVFRAQIERSTKLIAFANNNTSPGFQASFAAREEQATKQKSVAVSDGMIEGLRLRKPWNGFMINHVSCDAMVTWEAKGDADGVWLRLATEFSRLQSIAVQAPLAIRFSPALSEQLRKDLKLLWEDCIKSAVRTHLQPFLVNYEWVTVLLAKTLANPNGSLPERKPHIHSSRFIGYPEFVRSQLMLQIRDTTSAKRYLLDGLHRARNKSNQSAEVLLHMRLSDLTFELRNWGECIAHVEWIRDIMIRLGEPLSTVDYKAFAQATWRKGVCHNHLQQWDSAIEAFNEALSVCRHIGDRVTEYAILKKLAAIKREGGLGELTVTEALLRALNIAYDPALVREFAIINEHGVLLQHIVNAIVREKAGESSQSVIARLACTRDASVREMYEFVEELITREKEIVTADTRAGVPLYKTKKNLTRLYAEAERIMFSSPGTLIKQPLKFFAGSKWERGLLKKDC